MPSLSPTILYTERLKLRWYDERDALAQFAVFSDPQVTRFWTRPAWNDIAQAEAWIAKVLDDYADGSGLRLAIELASSGELAGHVSLFHFDEQNRRCEVGYALASAHWGRGYAAEAVAAALGYAFTELDMNRIEADIDPRNAASARVLERLGFTKEGYMPERWIVNGETADTAFYGLLKRHWSPPPGR